MSDHPIATVGRTRNLPPLGFTQRGSRFIVFFLVFDFLL